MKSKFNFAAVAIVTAVAAVTLIARTPAMAQNTGIEPFVGNWVGEAVTASLEPTKIKIQARDLDFEINPKGEGFQIVSNFVTRTRDEEEIRSRTLVFESVGVPFVWAAQQECDEVFGTTCAWAHMRDGTLVITTFGFTEIDKPEMQIFKRRVTADGNGMDYAFSRVLDGVVVRTLKGKIRRAEDQ